ncbi:MAG: type II secretion system protein GspH, partial [Candidatus Competibacteraceae bacterium]|nr:type II secretion system protein GspH [Candidatus Competibacteraceae bacterium]
KTRNLPDDDDVTIKLYTAQSELLDGTRGNIRFFPDGSSTGGYIALADAKVEYRVKVDWVTGHISIETRNAED